VLCERRNVLPCVYVNNNICANIMKLYSLPANVSFNIWFSVLKFCLPCVTLTCTVNVSLNVDGLPPFYHCAISVIALTIFGMFMSKTAEMHVLQFVKFRAQRVVEFDLLLSVLSPGIFLGIQSQTLSVQLFLLWWATKFHIRIIPTGKVTLSLVLLFITFGYYMIRQELLKWNQPFKSRIKSYLLIAGIISSPFSPR
jgi:hypothetical protein